MPLAPSGALLGQAILDAVDAAVAANGGGTPQQSALRTAIFKAMGEAIILHLVNPAYAPSVTVTTGAGAPGSGILV